MLKMSRHLVSLSVLYFIGNTGVESLLRSCTEPIDNSTVPVYKEIGPPILYHNVNSVLNVLQQTQYKTIPEIQNLLTYYYNAQQAKAKFDKSKEQGIRYPLIVLEGLSGTGKTTTAEVIAKSLNATQYHSPPLAIKYLRAAIRQNDILDAAYHFLAHYIAEFEVSQLLHESPIIMDRFWHSASSYAIAYAVNNYPTMYKMPRKGDKAYNWPEDLLKPDIVILLDVDENIRKQRIWGRNQVVVNDPNVPQLQRKFGVGPIFKNENGLGNFILKCPEFRDNLIQAYKNMQNPAVVVINGDKTVPEVSQEIYSKIQHLFPNIELK